MKLLTPEEVESLLEWCPETEEDAPLTCAEARRALNTLKAACERLAEVERCFTCDPDGETEPGWDAGLCPDCRGTQKEHDTWQDACRSLGDGAGREG
jgi:hypothetical protein